MTLFARALPGTAGAEEVLRRLSARATRRGLAPPAALTGEWFGTRAVLAPSVAVHATPPEQAFSRLDELPQVDGPPGAVGGGWIGYLGYGLTDPACWQQPRRLPLAAWGWADHVLRLDRDGQWWFEALRTDAEAVHESLREIATGPPTSTGSWSTGPVARPDEDWHCKAVRRCVDEIAAGEIYQANICTRFTAEFSGDLCAAFAAGSARFRPARAAHLAGSWGAIASLSPELFLSRHGNRVRSRPIKGTTPRRGPDDDHQAQRLRESTKDIAENVMILDMARNDLGRVAEIGSVTVPRLLRVEPHPGVWHLVSEVAATLGEDTSHAALLAATFPPASVTGAPKPRALEIIGELEAGPRDLYCGAVGMASPLAGLELNVAIRTIEQVGDAVHLGVGGGITADSDPWLEWQECLTKAAPVLDVLSSGG